MELDIRKQRILNAIVQDYVATAEPVGSQVLVERYSLGVKSATIRNEMAEMSERGFLRQPHTSAGRVPSDLGYRFYVNRLMTLPVVQSEEVIRIQQAMASAASELEAILRRTCVLLAEMTQLTAVATPPYADETELRQIFLSPAGADKVLLVLLFSNGHTEHRLLLETRLAASEALVLANALNERFGGTTLGVLRTRNGIGEIPPEIQQLTSLWQRIVGELSSVARSLQEESSMYVEGTESALNQPEFRDVERLGQFLTLLQQRAAVLDTLSSTLAQSGVQSLPTVQVIIGEETGRPEMTEFSIVSSPYYIGSRERGSIGVLGPTRMDYARTTAAVQLMARTMSDILTRLSFAS
jgi:heat-inducible transcriptional repressor